MPSKATTKRKLGCDVTHGDKVLLSRFYWLVCERAEFNMQHTGTVSGAHWNAMKQVLKELGIEVK